MHEEDILEGLLVVSSSTQPFSRSQGRNVRGICEATKDEVLREGI